MSSYVLVDRLQFAFTITYHYLFPILTMGLAVFVAWLKTVSYLGRENHRFPLWRKTEAEREQYETAARFWAKIFAVNFAVGVVTGIPMEFQFGTNWASFSNYAGGVIGQTLAMEGVFAFFAESVFLGIFLAGRDRFSPRVHWLSSVFLFVGSWLSGFFIIATNAWMQHPVAYSVSHNGKAQLNSLWGLFTNPWLAWIYAHNMSGAAITGAFVLAAMGALYLLLDRHHQFARVCLRVGVVGALIFCIIQIFPTGDRAAHNVAEMQPSAFAAMEGMFSTEKGAPLVILGNPNTEARRLDSSLAMPHFLSFLTSRNWNEKLSGLNQIPTNRWPDSVPLVYYAYHIMVGLGTILVAIAGLGVLLLWRGKLFTARPMLWLLMLAFPFTYIANIAGWVTAETGRQPWVIFGVMRTSAGASPPGSVPSGTGIFTLLGFCGLYLFVAVLYLVLMLRIVAQGPDDVAAPTTSTAAAAGAAPAQ
ncbi:MAG: cytochrome ubiquinol oxidase subunit I [Solirubrobacterales bacterium]|nr:cytochrome ubiquinol oxidase subunit I [Solirubrobacterales bacterium]MBV9367197.1 cytochrome ubiquinol oxidase subunit I [Solirubrobacterales bacterium]MBV9685233.1 cytochrome ubiquinol oxidase subunit I [Solirubrobacterales bacterium]MBV9808295.1 cytochrome ubiquinol oxidase subunit I [Solirubrobacterales bacterium]